MNENGKSDSDKVPEKFSNKSEKSDAEKMEGRKLTKENERQRHMRQTQGWESVHSKLQLVHQKAKEDKKRRFTALMHHIYDIDVLRAAYSCLKRNAAPGIDKETWRSYGENLEGNLQALSEKLKKNAYRAKPVRRVYIPKPDGRQRPLGVTALEDKVVQRATVEVLNAIYEADFLGYSYGFRPGRNQHKALDAVYAGLVVSKVDYVLDADIRDFFGSINHEWMVKFIEHRIADKRVVRLIQKWMNAGVLEDEEVTYSEAGTPQGGSISPLLANVYLHYAYDLWVKQWRKKQGYGNVIFVRFADDSVAGFQYKSDAEQFLMELKERLRKFGLELHPEKTRLIEFGRYASEMRRKRGEGKPETFKFLGFTHICGKTKGGKFTVHRQTIVKKLHAKVKAVKAELIKRMHAPIQDTGKWLKTVVVGHFQYFGVTGNFKAMNVFRYRVYWTWRRVLSRRSQKGYVTWNKMDALIKRWMPNPQIYHEHPLRRIGVITQGRSRVR